MVNRFLYALDQLFTPSCFICQQHLSHNQTSNYGICLECQSRLETPDHCCEQCGLPLKHQALQCGRCLKNIPSFDACISGWLYQEPLKSLLHQFKYEAAWSLGRQLTRLFYQQKQQQLQALNVDLALPVPMFYQRQQQRGHNHAEVICALLSKQAAWPQKNSLLLRQKPTQALHPLTVKERQQELQRAFKLTSNISLPAHIALIDDVITSGTTMNTISALLKQHGCQRVSAISLARTPLGIEHL